MNEISIDLDPRQTEDIQDYRRRLAQRYQSRAKEAANNLHSPIGSLVTATGLDESTNQLGRESETQGNQKAKGEREVLKVLHRLIPWYMMPQEPKVDFDFTSAAKASPSPARICRGAIRYINSLMKDQGAGQRKIMAQDANYVQFLQNRLSEGHVKETKYVEIIKKEKEMRFALEKGA